MKQTHHDMEDRLEAALNSLDGIRRAAPQPYFFTRLKARISSREGEWGKIAGFISRPVYALAMICIVLFVNTWIVFDNGNEAVPGNTSQVVNDLPEEYNLAVNTFYNYDIP
jgi:hypothetical protein